MAVIGEANVNTPVGGIAIPIKGKFVPHTKFFYFYGPQDSGKRKHENMFYFLIGSGLRITADQFNNYMKAKGWQYCAQCQQAGGAKDPAFHIEEKTRGEIIPVLIKRNGQEYDSNAPNVPFKMPAGLPESDSSYFVITDPKTFTINSSLPTAEIKSGDSGTVQAGMFSFNFQTVLIFGIVGLFFYFVSKK